MDTVQKAKELAKEIRGALVPDAKPPASDEIEGTIAGRARRYLDDAYATGKADGLRESEAEKKRVYELGKADGRKEAQEQT